MELNKLIDDMKEDIIKSTQEIIKIKSVESEPKPGMPFGEGVAKSLECALGVAKRLGLHTVNVDGYVGYAEYGTGDDYVLALGHLDIVPEGDGWIYPPYGAEIHDGKMYGRGTTDDKGPIMATLFGLKAIKDAKLPVSKRIRVLFGTNEETGSKELDHYLEKEKPPVAGFTPDADYPIINGEKGITIFDIVKDFNNINKGENIIKYIKGGQVSNMVPDYCEAGIISTNANVIVKLLRSFIKDTEYKLSAVVNTNLIIIKSIGEAAHGSTPEFGKNAIMQLLQFLGTINLDSNDASELVEFLNKNIGMQTHGESFGVCLEDKISGKLSFNVGVINMDKNSATVTLNLRYPVTNKLEDMMTPFNEKIKGTGLRVERFVHQEPLYFPPDSPIIKSLQKVYTEQTGEEATLVSIGGGTYAKEMPNIVAFGPMFPGEPDTIHKQNEYITIDNLIKNAKIYAHALYELAK
ncbi:dipeptidase PepV [Clostridium estertheticum]|uniref:dipeptidase PepV n=1 Tax=Clostridium estertheticum TaxID=238834 RepID=UPI001C7D7A56|nr:dipeptidase PepV [Clostridium estertheticum]MBX4263581.1 dipeptidase PepV [Clostridium estertheticum]WLC87407.1 dipeptidase PepV [Clostridium estertheticum]